MEAVEVAAHPDTVARATAEPRANRNIQRGYRMWLTRKASDIELKNDLAFSSRHRAQTGRAVEERFVNKVLIRASATEENNRRAEADIEFRLAARAKNEAKSYNRQTHGQPPFECE